MVKYRYFRPEETYGNAPSPYEIGKIKVLTDIANEMAEANRLKRLELDMQNIDNGTYSKEAITLALKDQAK